VAERNDAAFSSRSTIKISMHPLPWRPFVCFGYLELPMM
jgi:hypothetical protein